MPYLDPEARRKAHRASDIRHRARILAYRKVQRAALWTLGELPRLIAAQAKDARNYRSNDKLEFWDLYRVENGREVHRPRSTHMPNHPLNWD